MKSPLQSHPSLVHLRPLSFPLSASLSEALAVVVYHHVLPENLVESQFGGMPIPIGSMYGIYANIWGIMMVNVTIYSSTMDPMGFGNNPIFVPSWLVHLTPPS